jgi:hypothetical protein
MTQTEVECALLLKKDDKFRILSFGSAFGGLFVCYLLFVILIPVGRASFLHKD